MNIPFFSLILFLLVASCGINDVKQTVLPSGNWVECEDADSGTGTIAMTVVGDSFYLEERVPIKVVSKGIDTSLRSFKNNCPCEVVKLEEYKKDTFVGWGDSTPTEYYITAYKCCDSIFDPTVSSSFASFTLPADYITFYAKGTIHSPVTDTLLLTGYRTDSLFVTMTDHSDLPITFEEYYTVTWMQDTLVMTLRNEAVTEIKKLVSVP